LDSVTTPLLIAQEVHAEELQTLALFAARVEGNVRTVFTPLAAFALGAGFAATLLVMRAMLPKLFSATKAK
jgi:hypothetical protein